MIKKSLLVIAALVASMAMNGQASAVTFTLTDQNGAIPGPGPYATVTVNINGTGTSMTVTGTGLNSHGFIDTGFLGINGTFNSPILSSFTTNTGDTLTLDSAGNEDGFGSFALRVKEQSASNPVSTFSFTVTGNGFALSPNSKGYTVAAHMCLIDNGKCFQGLTGFAASKDANSPQVPEPVSALLLGVGLVSLGVWRRKFV